MKKQVGVLHFTVGEGINDIIRQAYWFEQRKAWANRVLDDFHGIKQEHKDLILKGQANIVPNDDGTMRLVLKEDKQFIKKLQKHVVWLEKTHTKIGGYYVSLQLYNEYMDTLRRLEIFWKYRTQGFGGNMNDYLKLKMSRLFIHICKSAGWRFKKKKDIEDYNSILDYNLNEQPLLQSYEEQEFFNFTTTFKKLVITQLDVWRKQAGKEEILKVLPITDQDERKAKNLHEEIVMLLENENPRPDLTKEEASLRIYDEIIAILEKYEDIIEPHSFAGRLLKAKTINRRMVKDVSDWQTLDSIRAGIHCIFDRTTVHGDVWKKGD